MNASFTSALTFHIIPTISAAKTDKSPDNSLSFFIFGEDNEKIWGNNFLILSKRMKYLEFRYSKQTYKEILKSIFEAYA